MKLDNTYNEGGPHRLPNQVRKELFNINNRQFDDNDACNSIMPGQLVSINTDSVFVRNEKSLSIVSSNPCGEVIPYRSRVAIGRMSSKTRQNMAYGMAMHAMIEEHNISKELKGKQSLTYNDFDVTFFIVDKFTIVELDYNGKKFHGTASCARGDNPNQLTGICIAYHRAFTQLKEDK